MKRLSILLAAIFAIVTLVSFSNVNAKGDFAVGSTLENFKLRDTNGKEQSFNELKGKNGAIVIFLSVQCPVVKGYDERIVKLAEDYKAKGVNVIGINSNSTESPERVKTHAAEKYKFPVLIDKGNVLADKFGANVTPEIYYFNSKNVLLYEGAIDNDRSGKSISNNYLRDALELSLSGKAITKTSANAFGCTIKRVE